MVPSKENLTKTKHYHVTVGPLEVNTYNIKGLTFMGPYNDVIVEDAEQAVRTWAGLANSIAQVTIEPYAHISDEDVEEIIEDVTSSEWAFEYDTGEINVGYEFGEGEQFVTISDCGGCIPKSNN